MLIPRLDYVLRTSLNLIKENVLILTKARSRHQAETMRDADYAGDLMLFL